MFHVTKSIDIDFAHHVAGHLGPCINIHGHTWKFELTLSAHSLDDNGFVVDFKELKRLVLEPVHAMLDHGLALAARQLFARGPGSHEFPLLSALTTVGEQLFSTVTEVHGQGAACCNRWQCHKRLVWLQNREYEIQGESHICGAYDMEVGGTKVIAFPFTPTSERLAKWFYEVACNTLGDERVTVTKARVYETLHPVESFADFTID